MFNSFDIVSLNISTDCRVLFVGYSGNIFGISEKKLSDIDMWIVSDSDVKKGFGERYSIRYPMVFGMLIEELLENESILPILGISFEDMDAAIMGGRQATFAKRIAASASPGGAGPVRP